MLKTDNYRKHTAKNPIQKYLINNFYKILVSEVKSIGPKSIIDVGCGEGFTLEKFRESKITQDLTGIDFYAPAILIGKRVHPNLKLIHGSIYEIPFKDNSFDTVICTEVLEHLTDPEKALTELKRVAKKYVVISVPNEPWFMLGNLMRGKNLSRLGNDIEHIQHWSETGIANLAGKYLEITKVRSPFPWTLLVARK